MFKRSLAGVAVVLCWAAGIGAATYYVDYDQGADTSAGTGREAAWQHAPGDSAATGNAKAAKLQPGDVVRLKGGVIYRGSITITASGSAGKPIVYDGNSDGTWGTGRAIIDGSVPLENLKRCASAEEAWGNANFKNIFWTTVPKGAQWNTLNVCQGNQTLAWSQDPNPADPVLQEDPARFHPTEPDIPQTPSSIAVRALGNMAENWQRPFVAMFDGSTHSAVIERINSGGEVEVTLPEAATVVEFSVTPQPRYTNPKEMSFLVDGKEVLKAEPAPSGERAAEQRFKLTSPVTFKTLVIRFVSAHPSADGTVGSWGAVQAIGGYDAAGRNVLLAERKSVLRSEKVFSQSDADHYDNALLALYARPAMVYYKRILGYNPAGHQIRFETLAHGQQPYEKGGAFSIVNSVRHIDTPGEYAMILNAEEDGSHRLFLWPSDGTPENLTVARHGVGIDCRGSFVTVQGLWIRKQGWKGSSGISARGQGSDLVIRDCKVSNLRGEGVGITTTLMDNVLVEGCEVSDNAGHTKGIVLRNAANQVVRGCTLRKNSSTALDFYTVTNGVVQDCLVIDNPGMHANGLTFYVGCKNILVERNVVRDGNVALTVQDGEGMIIRNNILEGGSGAPAIGLWSGGAYNNILITNNVLRYHGDKDSWAAAIYGGNAAAKGYAIVNNVIDGLSGNVLFKADLHHNLFTRCGPGLPEARLGDNLLAADLGAIFADAGKGDYRLKAGSPAIDAGVAVTSLNRYDRAGLERPLGEKVDIGPYEFIPPGVEPQVNLERADPRTFQFTFDGYTIAPPPKVETVYKMRFKKREGAETITRKGIDLSAEGEGEVRRRPARGGYIAGWDNPGHWLEWTVEVPKGGAYELAIEHASEVPATRQVLVNGQAVASLEQVAFPVTGSWTTFAKMGLERPLVLRAGKNVIRFVNVTGSLNFRSLEFIPVVVD